MSIGLFEGITICQLSLTWEEWHFVDDFSFFSPLLKVVFLLGNTVILVLTGIFYKLYKLDLIFFNMKTTQNKVFIETISYFLL